MRSATLARGATGHDQPESPVTIAGIRILLFALGEIGETRDARRLPIPSNDLTGLVEAYRLHAAGAALPVGFQKATIAKASDLSGSKSINIRHYWDKTVAQSLGLLGEDEDPVQAKKLLTNKMALLKKEVAFWEAAGSHVAPPTLPKKFMTVALGDLKLFGLSIGKRVLKKDIYQTQTGIPIFSANVRKPFGYSAHANAGQLPHGGVLWSIDSDFDCVGVSPGEVYTITDHCGQAEIKVAGIEPRYLASQIRQAGIDQGLSRDYRSSLGIMAEIEIGLPVKSNDTFDFDLMNAWSDFQEQLDRTAAGLKKLLSAV